MPRIPVRTEPYASPFRQHRHYKSKRDIILKALGKSSYINGSQFAVLFISARGDVETYASELLQDVIGLPREDELATEGQSLWREDVVREKRDLVQKTGERRRQEVQEKRGMMGAMMDKEGEGEDGSESEGEHEVRSPSKGAFRVAPASSLQLQSSTNGPATHDADSEDADTTLVEADTADFLPVKLEASAFHLSTPLDKPSWHTRGAASVDLSQGTRGLQDRIADTPRRAERERQAREAGSGHGHAMAVTPARGGRPASISLSAFKTPAPPTARTVTGHKASLSVELQQAGGQAHTDMSSRRPRQPANADLFMPSTPIRPIESDAAAADASTSQMDFTAAPTPATTSGPSSGATTHVLNIPMERLDDYLIERFNALQQTTCKLVVKTWIKVVEPKKQTRYPYNKGEASKPAWWPEGVRHREPDHLMKPERTHLLLAILLRSNVPAIKLELSTAEMSAYISQSKMKILREIYAVAKEEQQRAGSSSTGDLVVRLNGSPVDVKAVLPNSTPDPARLSSSHANSPAMAHANTLQSAKKRKGDGQDVAEADKENAPSSSQGATGPMPFSSVKLKRARANSTLETYGNGHGEQVSPLRRLSNMNISTPFSGSPLVREPRADGVGDPYGQQANSQGSPYLAAQYSPAMLPVWNGGNTSSPVPTNGFQVYPAAGPGPAMTESLKKRTQQRPSTGPPAVSRSASSSVSRLPLPSLNLPPQDSRPYSVNGDYYSATSSAPSPVMVTPVHPTYYAAMPQQQQPHRNMAYPEAHLAHAETPMSHSPFLVASSLPQHAPISSLAYPYAMQSQIDMHGMYDTFSPVPGAMPHTDGMFAFTPTLGGEQTEVAEDEFVWTQASS